MEAQPKFSVGQRVIRKSEGRGSTVLELDDNGVDTDIGIDRYIYYIQYDEGETPGTMNEGKGWWGESTLEAE
jgi:hypothetical protein